MADRQEGVAANGTFWGQSRLDAPVPWSRWQRFRTWMRRETLQARTLADVIQERNRAIRQIMEWQSNQEDGPNV